MIHKFKSVYIILHIDDCRITDPNQQDIDWVIQQIIVKFEIKNVDDSKSYLDMKIEKQINGNLVISQEQYIDELLIEFELKDYTSKNISMKKDLRIEFTSDDDIDLDKNFTHINYRKRTDSL